MGRAVLVLLAAIAVAFIGAMTDIDTDEFLRLPEAKKPNPLDLFVLHSDKTDYDEDGEVLQFDLELDDMTSSTPSAPPITTTTSFIDIQLDYDDEEEFFQLSNELKEWEEARRVMSYVPAREEEVAIEMSTAAEEYRFEEHEETTGEPRTQGLNGGKLALEINPPTVPSSFASWRAQAKPLIIISIVILLLLLLYVLCVL